MVHTAGIGGRDSGRDSLIYSSKIAGLATKPIPRGDVHFRILKTTERTQRLPISPLDPN